LAPGYINGLILFLGMPGETEAPCEALSTLVNNAPEVKGDTWPPKLNMLLVPVRVLGTLGGTYFLDVKKVIFKINSPDASMSLKRSVELGGVSLKLRFPHAPDCYRSHNELTLI